MNNYLNFLNKIIDDQVSENDLLSLDETQVIRSKETKFTVNKSQNFSVNEFKSNGNFNLFDIDGSLKFYVWVEETNICVYLASIVFSENSLENNFNIFPKTPVIHIL